MYLKRYRRLALIRSVMLSLTLVFTACVGDRDIISNVIVYENDFEDGDLTNISGGITSARSGTRSIGNYNNDGFILHLTDLPKHDYIYISFTLRIWDTWDGNSNGLEPDRPDKWIMKINDGIALNSDDYTGFETTFSNGPCDGVLCLLQSYPSEYPFQNQPRTGMRKDRVGFCSLRGVRGASSDYHIERRFRHDDAAIIFSFYDELYQPNVADQKCDESWSMDNIVVRAITLN